MDYDKYFVNLYNLQQHNSFLEVLQLLSKLGFKKNFKIFHVVGTNGKGSVVNFLSQGLQFKYKVGIFTSPHLLKINERIQINNKLISNQELYKWISLILKTNIKLSFFTLMYCAAMLYFAEKNVDFVILEAGIGGKRDITNLINGEYGVVTTVGLDHMKILGKSKRLIAKDKSGIIAREMTFFVPTQLNLVYRKIFIKKAFEKKAKIVLINNKNLNYKVSNYWLAVGILKSLKIKSDFHFKNLLGRTTFITLNNHQHIIDVGHNPSAVQAALKYLELQKTTFNQVVLSLSSDKDVKTILSLFSHKVFVYQNKSSRAMLLKQYSNGEVIKDLKQFTRGLEERTLFIGSFHLINEIVRISNEKYF